MKSTIFIFAGFFLLNVTTLFAQVQIDSVQKDSIEVKKSGFAKNGKILKPKELLSIMQTNPASYETMKIAKTNYDVGNVFASAGGFLIGWQLGAVVGGRRGNWAVAGIGAALTATAIPFIAAYAKHAKKAVNTYNNGMNQIGYNKVYVYPSLTSNGMGLTMRF